MKKYYLLLSFILLNRFVTYGQGTIRGKITDKTGETLIGASIILKSNPSIGVVTDFDGNYSIKLADVNPQTLIISYIGYQTMEETVQAATGVVIIKNFMLKDAASEFKQVEITAKATKAKSYYMEKVKMNSATTLDYVSSESMKKTGDANVTAAVTRVSGVATNGAFITVRGIGDRYVKTAINGSRVPTLDPFTNNIKLDLFPASLVDNIIITKTASPDLPGDWAGAYLSIETKDYPEEFALNVETTFGYNNQTSFKDVISSQRSSTEWMGYDNTLRDHNHNVFYAATIGPTQYDVLSSLGLYAYYKSMGIDSWVDNSSTGNTYFKLGLVQLGLLSPALFNDETSFINAKMRYMNGPYQAEAFKIINAKVPETGKSFANNWNTTVRNAPLNFSQTISIGNQTVLFGKTFGFIAGFRYGSSSQCDPTSKLNRESPVGDGNGNYILSVNKIEIRDISKETNSWSALINVACKLNSNNSVSLLFMPNITGVNNVFSGVDYSDPVDRMFTKSQFYEQRNQFIYQFKSEHYLPSHKLKIESNASYTNGKSNAPDFKNLQYKTNSNQYLIGNGIGDGIHRYFRYLKDDLLDSRLSVEFPLSGKLDLLRKIKFGSAFQWNDKKSDQYDYEIISSTTNLPDGDLDNFLDLDNFNIHSYTDVNSNQQNALDLYYLNNSSAADHAFGNSTVLAGYVMADYSINSFLRISGGLRVEHAKILTDVFKFDSLGLAPNDPRREYKSGMPVANPGKLNETSYLPCINVIYKLRNDEITPCNLRFNFSQSVARPSIRELSDIAVFDYELRGQVFGNSDLKMVQINNYDVRIESVFKSGESFSASVFYKDFKNHIELVKTGGYSWQNVDKSHVVGLELEGRKKLTNHLDLSTNITISDSRTEFVRQRLDIAGGGIKNYIPQDTVKRTMFGQAPYVINAILSYSTDSLGLIVTLSYNIQGARLVIASDNKLVPNIYEQPRHLFDLKISKKLGRHFSASFTVRDLLNTPVRRTYGNSSGTKLDYDKYTWGTNYLFGLTYKI